jgi:hypothetical protein
MSEIRDLHTTSGLAEQGEHRCRCSAEVENDMPFARRHSGDEVFKQRRMKRARRPPR